jgi:lipid II:glycine glycyltransferase (peptidoglycan interpeptide bridge formation enzyme)
LNLLFYNIFKWSKDNKVQIYDFGTFTLDGVPNFGLGRFKENFGASGVFRDTMQISL